MTTRPTDQQWRARPTLAAALQCALLGLPLLTSSGVVWLLARSLPDGAARTWWGLSALLLVAMAVALLVERGTRRLLPIALLLRLSMIFPDRAPSRFKLARAAALRTPREQLLWTGTQARPTSTSELVLDLVQALGSHDRRTRGHSERVRLLTDVLASELALDAEARDRLRWAALLHDVGKMEVAPSILNKPSRLDDREFDTVKQHPQAGAALTAPLMPWLGEWGLGIVDHHEKYDGTGYPAGKSGEEISLAGRIIGLVDAFETMTAARPYKKAVATEAARRELVRCAGTHFDPTVVRAFLAVSLPRVLWAMGPLSFLLQLPFLRPVAYAGSKGAVVAPQAASALAAGAAGAAGAAVLVTSGVVTSTAADTAIAADRAPVAVEQLAPPGALSPSPLVPAPAAPSPQDRPADAPAAAPTASAPAEPAQQTPVLEAQPAAPAGAVPAAGGTDQPSEPAAEQPKAEPAPVPAPAESDLPDAEPSPAAAAPTPAGAPSTAPSPAPSSSDAPASPAPASPVPPVETSTDGPAPDEAPPTGPSAPPAAEPSPAASVAPAPVEAAPSPAPSAEATAEPAPSPSPAAPAPAPPPANSGDTSQANGALLSGPPPTTTSRSAVFELSQVDGVQWECQVLRNASGDSSSWLPCAGTYAIQLDKDGTQTLRVRNAATGAAAGSWVWSVTSQTVAARGIVDPVPLALPAPAPVPPPQLPLLLMALTGGLALPVAMALRRLRERRG